MGKSLFLFLISAIVSTGYAADYPEPGAHRVIKAKDYYKAGYGYDSSKSCNGPMCIRVGSTFACSSYSYPAGPRPGTKLQVCNLKSITTPDKAVLNIENQRFTTTTGFVDSKGKFIGGVPKNEIYLADSQGKVFKYIPDTRGTTPLPDPLPEGEVCDANCGTGEKSRLRELADSVMEAVNPVLEKVPSVQTSTSNKQVGDALKALVPRRVNNKCTSFIGTDGSMGPWGRQVVDNFKTVCNECFFGSNNVDVSALCPKFKSFDQKTKEYFWVWTVMSMAQKESSCTINANVRGTKVNGVWERAVGLLQMEQSWRRRRVRGNECSTRESEKETVYSTGFQFRCSASIIRDTRWKRGKPLAGGGGQYWQELRSNNDLISNLIKQFPGCR